MTSLIVVAHNIRSTHNVGAIFRTCEGLGVSELILSGYTPYPQLKNDQRLPHIAAKLTAQIHKTALGAETSLPFQYYPEIPLEYLRSKEYRLVALEQHDKSIPLPEYTTPAKVALILGEEVHGIERELLDVCDDIVEIPMVGQKESFNVSVAAGMALYQMLLAV